MLKKLMDSFIFQIPATLVTYALYGIILGASLFPPGIAVAAAFRHYGKYVLSGTGGDFFSGLFILCVVTGISVFLFFISGLILMGIFIRLLSLGIKPGNYDIATPTMFRWLIYSGIYTMATQLILPVVPMTFFAILFFKMMGCRIGKNTHINTYILNDPYMLEIGDNVVIGGQTDISCHLFENNRLILEPIKIGSNSQIGAHCYISPGVTIGENCIIGLNSYIRRGKTIPDNTRLTSVGAVSFRTAGRMERE